MKLTPGRKAIIENLIRYRYLTTKQFYRLFKAETDSAQRNVRYVLNRLSKPQKNGNVVGRRYFTSNENPEGKFPVWEFMYWLSPSGINGARAEGFRVELAKPTDEKSSMMLPHEQGLTDVHIALAAAFPALWWQQTNLRHDLQGFTVSPDALLFLDGYYYFLEFENSKPSHYRKGESSQMRKARLYTQYSASKEYKKKWPEMNGFFMLYIVRNNERRQNLIAELSANYSHLLFLVASVTDIITNPTGKILYSPVRAPRAFIE